MSSPVHTYGPTCLLYSPEHEATIVSSDPSGQTEPPKIRAQFFYISSFPIDDPLTALPPTTSTSNASRANFPPQPFAVRDNIALEEAWNGLRDTIEKEAADNEHETDKVTGAPLGPSAGRRFGSDGASNYSAEIKSLAGIALDAALDRTGNTKPLEDRNLDEHRMVSQVLRVLQKYVKDHEYLDVVESDTLVSILHGIIRSLKNTSDEADNERYDITSVTNDILAVAKGEIPKSIENEHNEDHLATRRDPGSLSHKNSSGNANSISFENTKPACVDLSTRDNRFTFDNAPYGKAIAQRGMLSDSNQTNSRKRCSPPSDRRAKALKTDNISSPGLEDQGTPISTSIPIPNVGSLPFDPNISGSPFVRAPARDPRRRIHSASLPTRAKSPNAISPFESAQNRNSRPPSSAPVDVESDADSERVSTGQSIVSKKRLSTMKEEPHAVVPVGVSRLHLVEFPSLQVF